MWRKIGLCVFPDSQKYLVYGILSIIEFSRTDGRSVGQTDGRSDGRTDGRSVGQTDGRPDGRTVGRTDGRTGGRTVGDDGVSVARRSLEITTSGKELK